MPRTSTPSTPVSRAVTAGAALTFETVPQFDVAPPPLRIHPDAATLLRVIDGIISLTVGDEDRLLGIGDEAIVPAGHPHRIASLAGEARLVMGFRATP
jgi:mannose-6-phosphate isomerase-like protein (cupin superfamily)